MQSIWLPLGVFLAVVAIVVGAYWALVLRQEEQLIGRLTPRREKTKRSVLGKMVKPEEQMSSVGAIQDVLERSGTWVRGLRELVEQSGLSLNVGTLLLMMACAGIGGYLLVLLLSRLWYLAVAAGAFAAFIPYW